MVDKNESNPEQEAETSAPGEDNVTHNDNNSDNTHNDDNSDNNKEGGAIMTVENAKQAEVIAIL